MAVNFNNKKNVETGAIAKANKYTDEKYQHTLTVIYAVLIVIFLVFIQVVIDSFRFSSVTYREYENRIEERSILLLENKVLLEQIAIYLKESSVSSTTSTPRQSE